MQQRQQQQQNQQQQLYLRNPGMNVGSNVPNQVALKSASLKSPSRSAQITQTSAFTPSAVVFRNYRVTGGDSNYQTTASPSIPKKNAFQRLDCQYTGSGIGGTVAFMSSNNGSLLSKTSDLIDTSDPKDSELFGILEKVEY